MANKLKYWIKGKIRNQLLAILELPIRPNYFPRLPYNPYELATPENIKIGKRTYVENDAKIRIRNGGKIEIGDNCEILDGAIISTYGGDITIGNNCSINPYTLIFGTGGVRIGNNVLIAAQCMIVPVNHNFDKDEISISEQGHNAIGIIIEDDIWIGHGCSILDGVKIGKGSIIGAGSVVTKEVPPNSIFGGIPARLIRNRFEK